jgi:polysaccharide pyruvyl transferase WcaK-like protein
MNKQHIPASSPDASDMRVLVENGEYWLNNKGDLSILDVTLKRIAGRWPHVRIGVLTSAPELLRAYAPQAEPVHYERGGDWSRRRLGKSPIGRFGSERAGPLLHGLDAAAALPAKVTRRLQRMTQLNREGKGGRTDSLAPGSHCTSLSRDGGQLPNAVADASAVIAIGGGYLTDVDSYQTERTLDLLGCAIEHGIPTVMLGQGIGPMEDPRLLARAAAVFPRVDLIALREGRRGPELLRSLGVADERMVVTGDDAVELAYTNRRSHLGNDIGVCLRVAEYSPVDVGVRKVVSQVLQDAAAEHRAGLVPLIVSEYADEDRRSTLPLLAGSREAAKPLGRFASAGALTREVGRCRVVVTGAYHVAVFSLSQGIPVVGLSTSQYYDDKFEGLAAMFGTGLELVRLDEHGLQPRLQDAIDRSWVDAPALRPVLLDAAIRQVEASRAAFERAAGLIDRAVSARSQADPSATTSLR